MHIIQADSDHLDHLDIPDYPDPDHPSGLVAKVVQNVNLPKQIVWKSFAKHIWLEWQFAKFAHKKNKERPKQQVEAVYSAVLPPSLMVFL